MEQDTFQYINIFWSSNSIDTPGKICDTAKILENVSVTVKYYVIVNYVMYMLILLFSESTINNR